MSEFSEAVNEKIRDQDNTIDYLRDLNRGLAETVAELQILKVNQEGKISDLQKERDTLKQQSFDLSNRALDQVKEMKEENDLLRAGLSQAVILQEQMSASIDRLITEKVLLQAEIEEFKNRG